MLIVIGRLGFLNCMIVGLWLFMIVMKYVILRCLCRCISDGLVSCIGLVICIVVSLIEMYCGLSMYCCVL